MLALAVTVCLATAGGALGDSTTSGNWAGYSAHRSAVNFRSVSARWRVPAGSCSAGSDCDQGGNCFALPLADFGTASVSSARAVTQSGHTGTVTSRWWGTTTITLRPHGTRTFAGTADGGGGEAIPSPLSIGGSAFSVSYQAATAPTNPAGPAGPYFRGRETGQRLVHPARRVRA